MKILVINCGSSSLKYQLIDIETEKALAKGLCERIGIEGSRLKHTPLERDTVTIEKPMENHADGIKMVLEALVDPKYGVIENMEEISAVGHRVVHGGEFFNQSVIINEEVKEAIEACVPLAPLHNPANLIGINACESAMPGVPQVAVFDTAFHQTMPKEAYMYALPYELYEKDKIRKYGFHGTSHKYVALKAAEMLGKPLEETNIITFHLGNGSSVTAVKNGVSVDTSMGFTPLAGVIMGTRCGTIDAAIVKYLAEKEKLNLDQIDEVLNKKSGVLGISGVSSDFRDLEAAAKNGHERAQLALDVFAYSVRRYLGEYAVVLGRVDAVVFTAGVGENTAFMREAILKNTEILGIKMDVEKNKTIKGVQADVSAPDSNVKVFVIPTNEELMIARETEGLIK